CFFREGERAMAGSRITPPRASLALPALVALLLAGCTVASHSDAPIKSGVASAAFGNLPNGSPTGQAVELFTLRNAHGIEVQFTNYGGIITSLKTPDRAGRFSDIVLGYDNLAGYLASSPYFGAIVGRYANRIARGHFTLDGVTYTLADRKSTRLNSSHLGISYAVFCLK